MSEFEPSESSEISGETEVQPPDLVEIKRVFRSGDNLYTPGILVRYNPDYSLVDPFSTVGRKMEQYQEIEAELGMYKDQIGQVVKRTVIKRLSGRRQEQVIVRYPDGIEKAIDIGFISPLYKAAVTEEMDLPEAYRSLTSITVGSETFRLGQRVVVGEMSGIVGIIIPGEVSSDPKLGVISWIHEFREIQQEGQKISQHIKTNSHLFLVAPQQTKPVGG